MKLINYDIIQPMWFRLICQILLLLNQVRPLQGGESDVSGRGGGGGGGGVGIDCRSSFELTGDLAPGEWVATATVETVTPHSSL